jgi:multidrug resistance efflux pump
MSDNSSIQATSNNSLWQKLAMPALIILLIGGGFGGIWYWQEQQKFVYTDNASIGVPIISLSPKTQGKLKKVLVNNGDQIVANQTIALIGNETVKSEIDGQIISVNQDIGHEYKASEVVATMIEPNEMKVLALVEENKGLSNIRIGQSVLFTVDAYGSEKFDGIVDSISNSSHEGDIVFNISDKRQEKKFEIKIKYDHNKLPQFQNGMSAKVWIIK